MAKLFLSYSRKDASRARRLTEWLELHDHDVWRDEDDIRGGASFSNEIEEALEDCDAVLVLWSADSVKSPWVRDEAGYGRDNGKLIPLALDGTLPPLGFRQFQSIDLAKWKGKGEPPRAEQILRAIGTAGHAPDRRRADFAAKALKASYPGKRFPGGAVLLAIVALAIAGAAFLAWRTLARDSNITIAVAPSPTSPDKSTATDYANVSAADMAEFLPRRFDRASVIGPGDAAGQSSDYRMRVSVSSHGAAADASLTLADTDGRTTLWSKNWSVADASAADLKADVSASASKVAFCLMQARADSNPLSQPALGLYLSGCADLGDTNRSSQDFTAIFERVTKLAPNFAPAWDYLALVRSWVAEGLRDSSSPAYAPALQLARETIAKARKLNPNSAMSYDADYHVNSNDTFRALRILQQGARIDPDDGRIQMHLSDELISVGRMLDSVQAAQRGVELEPGSPYTTSQYILALVYSGEFSKATAAIFEARKKWPADPTIDFADFTYHYRYGDPHAALGLLPRVGDFTDADMLPVRKVIEARIDPSPAKVDDAIAATNLRFGGDPRTRNNLFRALVTLGRVDQAYQLLEDPKFLAVLDRSALFRPDFVKVRADSRFMQIAAQVGLARYWERSGYWPDFCSSEKLPYDCKKEAAKYQ